MIRSTSGEKMQETDTSESSFTSAMTLDQMGLPSVPERYILPPSQRPNPTLSIPISLHILAYLSPLNNPSLRSETIDNVRIACKELGFFQVINHGIPASVMNDASDSATEFFDLSSEEKMSLASSNVHEPVRYGTSLNHVKDKVHFWRDFIKHYSHPVSNWIDQWPSNPPSYKLRKE
ncbi:LOW QUALITY PROTEIN: hypothetical protein RJ639_047529 [Escallonia herrerae]|uniref:Non-haem dioxygenase N-terminal domain-containing protein n=1 Tax=Escallonia herrerae TaxID=1293975 RepID=A0AA88W7F7_9ASTE|nr:LOW QUALITY PROTEIN: hypothetical protein RJ639_047529 [Escallonia herrerae]